MIYPECTKPMGFLRSTSQGFDPSQSRKTFSNYAELSELGRYYIGGLLTHAWALCGLCAPTTNSYRRLV